MQKSDATTTTDDGVKYLVKVDITENELYNGISIQTPSNEAEKYLNEKVLPVLVPCLHQVIHKFYNRQDNVADEISPVNFLAMELMRNNPKHSTAIRNHPYYKLLCDRANAK